MDTGGTWYGVLITCGQLSSLKSARKEHHAGKVLFLSPHAQGTSRFLAQGKADGIPIFFTNSMIFLECGLIALFEAFYMFRDNNHVKMKF